VSGARVKTGKYAGYYHVFYAAGLYGGSTWAATTVVHALDSKDYGTVWVAVQATDKACAR
jgi:hypothetical protein